VIIVIHRASGRLIARTARRRCRVARSLVGVLIIADFIITSSHANGVSMRLCCVRINHFAPAPPNDVDEDTSCRRWTRATRCLTRIVPYTEVDAQRDKPAKVVDRTSTVASNVNLVRSTTVQLIKTSEHICAAKLQRTALLRLPYLYLDCNDQRAVAKFFQFQSLGQSSRRKYPHFGDTRISLQHSVVSKEASMPITSSIAVQLFR